MDDEWRREGGVVEAEMVCEGDLLSQAGEPQRMVSKIAGKKIQLCIVKKEKRKTMVRVSGPLDLMLVRF